MQKEQIVGIAIRLFSVFLLIYTIRNFSEYINILVGQSYFKENIIPLIILTSIPLVIVVLLWLFPLKVASKLIPKINNSEASFNIKNNEIEYIAFPILGIWVLANAIPDMFYWITQIYIIKSIGLALGTLRVEDIGNIVATIAEIIIGLWLLLGAKGIIGLVRRLRYAGQ